MKLYFGNSRVHALIVIWSCEAVTLRLSMPTLSVLQKGSWRPVRRIKFVNDSRKMVEAFYKPSTQVNTMVLGLQASGLKQATRRGGRRLKTTIK